MAQGEAVGVSQDPGVDGPCAAHGGDGFALGTGMTQSESFEGFIPLLGVEYSLLTFWTGSHVLLEWSNALKWQEIQRRPE